MVWDWTHNLGLNSHPAMEAPFKSKSTFSKMIRSNSSMTFELSLFSKCALRNQSLKAHFKARNIFCWNFFGNPGSKIAWCRKSSNAGPSDFQPDATTTRPRRSLIVLFLIDHFVWSFNSASIPFPSDSSNIPSNITLIFLTARTSCLPKLLFRVLFQ